MADHAHRPFDLAGTPQGSVTVRDIRWLEAVRVRGDASGGKAGHDRVTLEAGSTLEGS